MASETYSGIGKAFIGDRLFTGAEIDAIFSGTPSIPAGTGAGKMNWKQIMHNEGFEIMIPRKITKQRTQPEGVRKIVQDEDDGPEVTIDINDITLAHLVKTLGIGNDLTLAAKAQKITSGQGRNLSLLGLPILIYHSEYDPDNVSNTPLIGAGSSAITSENLGTQTGITDNYSVILGASGSATDDTYNGMMIDIVISGQPTQTRRIIDYTGSTKKAVLDSPLIKDPTASDTYRVYAGTLSADPKAFLFFNCVVMSDRRIPFRKPQQIIPVTFSTVISPGSSDSGGYGAMIDLSQCTTTSA